MLRTTIALGMIASLALVAPAAAHVVVFAIDLNGDRDCNEEVASVGPVHVGETTYVGDPNTPPHGVGPGGHPPCAVM